MRDPSLRGLFDELDSITHHGTLYVANRYWVVIYPLTVVVERALVQHATSTSATESPALNTARRALRLTVESRKQYNGLLNHVWSAHCHW